MKYFVYFIFISRTQPLYMLCKKYVAKQNIRIRIADVGI